MASISGLVYVGAGALVSVISLLIGEEFRLFFYVGLAFLVFGSAVSFIGSMHYHGAKKEEEKRKRAMRQANAPQPPYAQQQGYAPGQHAPHHGHSHQVQGARPQPQQQYKMCARCRTPARLTDNFCPRCGLRI